MTQPTDLFPDPSEEFFAQGITPAEESIVAEISDKETTSLAEAAFVLGLGFFAYRWYMQRRVKELMKDQEPTSKNMNRAIQLAYMGFRGHLVQMIVPQLITGYAVGLADVRFGNVPPEMMYDLAENYAVSLGHHINETTAEAVLQGYQAQLNRKVPPARAMNNVVDALGVDSRTMNSLVSVWTTKDEQKLSTIIPVDRIKERSNILITSSLERRARTLGDNETWVARNQAKQIIWMYGVNRGAIPVGTKRRWITADDERVCPSCGPLHKVELPVTDKFDVPNTRGVWSPPVHVNCRCDVELVLDISESLDEELSRLIVEEDRTLVTKARGSDPFDRDKSGRFASQEGRQAAKPRPVKEREVDPVLADMLRGLELTDPELKQKVDTAIQERAKVTYDTSGPRYDTGVTYSQKAQISSPSYKTATIGSGNATMRSNAQMRTGAEILSNAIIQPVSAAYVLGVEAQKTEARKGTNPNWETLQEPIARLLIPEDLPYEKKLTFTTDSRDQDWYLVPDLAALSGHPMVSDVTGNPRAFGWGIDSALHNYWSSWMDSKLDDYWMLEDARDSSLMYSRMEDGKNKTVIEIPPDVFEAAIIEAVYHISEQQSERYQLPQTNLVTGVTKPVAVTAAEVADYFGLYDDVREATPAIVLARHADPRSADFGTTDASVPGRWVQVGPSHNPGPGEYPAFPYTIIDVEPEDLYE